MIYYITNQKHFTFLLWLEVDDACTLNHCHMLYLLFWFVSIILDLSGYTMTRIRNLQFKLFDNQILLFIFMREHPWRWKIKINKLVSNWPSTVLIWRPIHATLKVSLFEWEKIFCSCNYMDDAERRHMPDLCSSTN